MFLLASLAIMFGPGLVEHVRLSTDPWSFNDDARVQIAAFVLENSAAGTELDYTSTYFLDSMPRGYRQLYRSLGNVVDPRVVSKILPYLLVGATLLFLGLAARDLGGAAAQWGTLALCLGGAALFDRTTGGLPRAFAFPLVALMALGLTRDRPIWIAIATVASALFYYSTAVLGGFLLILYTLWMSRGADPGAPAGRRLRRWYLLLGTGALTALLVLPVVLSVRDYGPAVTRPDAVELPELGPDGRRRGADLPGGRNLDQHLSHVAHNSFFGRSGWPFLRDVHGFAAGHWRKISWILIGVVGLASVPLARTRTGMRRLLLLPLASLLAYSCAKQLSPLLHLPERYLAFSLPVFVYLALPAGIIASATMVRRLRSRPWVPATVGVALIVIIVVALGNRGPASAGFITTPESERTMIKHIGELPTDAVVVGWPWGLIDNVRHTAARNTWISYESHVMVHREYVREMRRRMLAVIDAYFATSPAPLVDLRDRLGVTHLLIDLRHFTDGAPWYFEPFARDAERARNQLEGRSETVRQAEWATVAEDGPFRVLDLALLRTGPADR